MIPALLHLTTTWNPSDVIVSDIEANGLLRDVTKFHCASSLNPFTLEERIYGPDEPQEYLLDLDRHQVVAGHNFKGFDLLALRKLFGFEFDGMCFDTAVLSRLLNPERKLHSLESYGRQFKFLKGDYKDAFKARAGENYQEGDEWREFNQEMMDYCVQDVRLNAIVFLYFVKNLGWAPWFVVTKATCEASMKAIFAGEINRVGQYG